MVNFYLFISIKNKIIKTIQLIIRGLESVIKGFVISLEYGGENTFIKIKIGV